MVVVANSDNKSLGDGVGEYWLGEVFDEATGMEGEGELEGFGVEGFFPGKLD